jgi:hypothetical protein
MAPRESRSLSPSTQEEIEDVSTPPSDRVWQPTPEEFALWEEDLRRIESGEDRTYSFDEVTAEVQELLARLRRR